ncbi:MAG: MarR family transcriptional regulator [Lachnospiraceae bacterium]|nr:MarR family transcriptional regulator [Lachnospiraceae bacterium]
MPRHHENSLDNGQRMAHYHTADINDKLIINMRDLNHIMRFLYEGKTSQKRILIILREVGSITQRDLTKRLGIQPGSASEVLSKLESAGLVMRTVSETDRRTTIITLTKQGMETAAEAAKQRNQRHVEMFSCLSGHEKEELLVLLEKINDDWAKRYQAVNEQKQKCHEHSHSREKHCNCMRNGE